ncbi:putative protein phosphatase 2C 9 [Gossypium australe]|uniref:Uncharacterized protein n=1 Tax=Gossypium australe TaxID=47621 RepID=A0A5B6UTU5_9ROSI|nr:putative protein phosphatase 2C 9 [Gossypium australe]
MVFGMMSNQEAVDIAKNFKDLQKALKQLIMKVVKRDSKYDISYVVVRFRGYNCLDEICSIYQKQELVYTSSIFESNQHENAYQALWGLRVALHKKKKI